MQRTGTPPAQELSTRPLFHFLPLCPFDAGPAPLVAMRLELLVQAVDDNGEIAGDAARPQRRVGSGLARPGASLKLAACRNDRSLRHDSDLRRTSAAGDPRAGLYGHLRARPAGDAQVLRRRDALRSVPRAGRQLDRVPG